MIEKLKRAVIREELIALTGDAVSAVILGQMLYWCERTSDIDRYIAEESKRDTDAKIEPTHGWVYKSGDELADEIMMGVSGSTVSRRLQTLVDRKWLQRRRNPRYAWDRTWQYRPDMHRLRADLERLGYALEGYPILEQVQRAATNLHSEECKAHGATSITQPADAISETTTETTTERAPDPPSEPDTNKSTTDNGATRRSLPRSARTDDRRNAPIIKCVRAVTNRYPNRVLWDRLIEQFPDPPDGDRMKRCYTEWVARGFNPTNMAWLFEWYANETIPSAGQTVRHPQGPPERAPTRYINPFTGKEEEVGGG